MEKSRKIIDNHSFFVDFSLFWIIFGWLALILALLNFFYGWIFIVYLTLGISYFIWILIKNKKGLKISKSFSFIVFILLFFITILSFFSEPTVFTGRDQGSISNAAISLSKNHQLHFSSPVIEEFFSIYGPGKALNFPGFHYTDQGKLTTQFPLGYISWLSAFYSIFDIKGLIIANSTALFIFFLSFYMIGRKLLKKRYTFIMMFFAITSFSFYWFAKLTLSENLALALLWTMIMGIIYLIQTPNKKTLLLFILSSTLLVFTRVEGYAFLLTSGLILLFCKTSRIFIKKNYKTVLFAIIIFIFIFSLNFQKDLPFFKEIGKATLGSFFETETDGKIVVKSLLSPGVQISQIYIIYGLAGFFILGFIGIIQSFLKKQWEQLIPLFVVFPTFIYLIDSNISSDHPWMLRRFVFAILPVFVFYSVKIIKYLLEKNSNNSRHPIFLRYLAIGFSIILLSLNLKSFCRYAFFYENKGLLQQTEKLSEKFSNKDLILIDRLSSGDGWSLLAGPLQTIFNKQAVYFFNPSDLQKINLNKFENIYLLATKDQLLLYANSEIGNKFNIKEKHVFETTRLIETSKNDLLPIERFPQKEIVKIEYYILEFKK